MEGFGGDRVVRDNCFVIFRKVGEGGLGGEVCFERRSGGKSIRI